MLRDHEILLAGGEDFLGNTVATAELYDPKTSSFTPTGSLATSLEYPAVAALPDGSVLVAGGLTSTPYSESVLASAEIYDPSTGNWSVTGSMPVASDGLTATLLDNGLVLVTGFPTPEQELYHPSTGSWSATGPMPSAGSFSLSALLRNGQVLLAGGPGGISSLYDPRPIAWMAPAPWVRAALVAAPPSWTAARCSPSVASPALVPAR